MAEVKVTVTKREVEMIQNGMRYGKTDIAMPEETPAPEPVVLNKASDVLKSKVVEPVAPIVPVVEPVAVVEPVKAVEGAKVEPVKAVEPTKVEPVKTVDPVIVTQAILDETAKELDSLKLALGEKYTPEMDDKLGRIMASDNFDMLIKGGYTPKQAVTQMALMSQGFVNVNKEDRALISRKIEEVKTSANLTQSAPTPAASGQTQEDLIKEWGNANNSMHSKALGKLLNADADADLVSKAMGYR